MRQNPHPMNSREWWDEYFSVDLDAHDDGDQTRRRMELLLNHLPAGVKGYLSSRPLSILDWGCAFGEGVELAANSFPKSKVTGLDFVPTAIEEARRRHPDREFILTQSGEIPIEFDVIITSDCLERFEHPVEITRKHLRSCKSLYIALVPYNEFPLPEHHRSQLKIESFPEHVGVFSRLCAKTIEMDPASLSGHQLLVVYASQSYLREQSQFENQTSEQEKWDSYYGSLPLFDADEAAASFNAELVEQISELLLPGSKILEAGCGGGWQSLALARSGRFQVSLMDSSRQALGYARRLFEREQVSAEFSYGDVFSKGKPEFDLVFNAGVLEHYTLEEQARFLKGMASRSRKYVLALVPNRSCYWYWLWRIQKSSKAQWPFGKEVPLADFSSAFDAAGLQYLGETFMGGAWTEVFIRNLSGLNSELSNEILEIHRSPIISQQERCYLLAGLGSVSSEPQDVPAIWKAGPLESRDSADSIAALSDALAIKIATEQQMSKLQMELTEKDRALQEMSSQDREDYDSEGREPPATQKHVSSDELNEINVLESLLSKKEHAHSVELAKLHETIQSLKERLSAMNMPDTGAVSAEIREHEKTAAAQAAQLIDKDRTISSLSAQLAHKERELSRITGTLGWRLLKAFGPVKYRYLLPIYRFLGLPPYGSNAKTKQQPSFSPSFDEGSQKTEAFPTALLAEPRQNASSRAAAMERLRETLSGQQASYDVVCFPIIDWDFRFQRPQQMMLRFASAGHRVFYLAHDFNLSSSAYTITEKSRNVFEVKLCGTPRNVYTADLSDHARDELFASLDALRRDAGLGATLAFVQLPFWSPLAEKMRAQFGWPIVYDCMDYHAGFSTNRRSMIDHEHDLLSNADLVVVSSSFLEDKAKNYESDVLLLRNACDYDHFAEAKATDRNGERTVIGYYGAIADWFDSDLVADLAEKRPDWDFVLVGSTFSADIKRLSRLPNVSLPGEKHYSVIPQWLATFDVAIIPFRRTPLTEATNPVKAYEILASGKPLVSVPIPEMTALAPLVRLASTAGEFEKAITEALGDTSIEAVQQRQRFAKQHTWLKRFEALDPRVRQTFPKASIIIVTFNNLELNKLCLESLYARTDWPRFEVIIIDNGSSDGTAEYLLKAEKTFPNCRAILNEKNLGFAAANNIGLREASGEYLVLLNNDTVLTKGWLSALIKHLHANPKIGLLGPVTNAIANEAKIEVGYGQIDEMHSWAENFVRENDGQIFPIPMLAMFCVAMRREVYDRVGPLDERFEVGMFEDDDYCRRISELGYELRCARDSFVHHWQRAGFRVLGDKEYFRVYEENRKRYQLKWADAGRCAPPVRRLSPDDDHREQLNEVLARVRASKGAVTFLPSIGWDVHLFQRPHHLAQTFARNGYVSIFDSSNSHDDVRGFKEIEPNLFLFHGDEELLHEIPDTILWTFPYNFDRAEGYGKSARTIYDWIDALDVFPYDRSFLARNHERGLRDGTLVTAVTRQLQEAAQITRPDAIYLPNAVEYEHFASDEWQVPNDNTIVDFVRQGKPIAGYYGALADWFDYQLLDEVAALRPDWNFLLIGQMLDQSLSRQSILNRSNVKWDGPRPYASLPGYLKLFDVAMIPFVINSITLATSPLKLYEYFAGGKAVITTAMPECESFSEVRIVRSAEEFSHELDRAREQGRDEQYRARVRAVARDNSWTVRMQTVEGLLHPKGKMDDNAARPPAPATSRPESRPGAGALPRQELLGAAANIAENFSRFSTAGNSRFFDALCQHLSDLQLNPCLPMYFEFAITANDRGRKVATLLRKYTPLGGKRCLDIGCAYGGFLVAFAQEGAEVIGIDTDQVLLELARQNLRDNNIEAPLLEKDATRSEALRELRNSFDIITCNDVIEHVDDPRALLGNVYDLLREDGIAYFEIPNRYHPHHVLQDGHYQLFGITLLDYPEAQEYFSLHAPDVPYGVRHYLEIDQYTNLFEQAGMTFTLMDESFEGFDMQAVLNDIANLRAAARAGLKEVPAAINARVQNHLHKYLSEIETASVTTGSRDRDFMVRYGSGFWRVLGRKISSAQSPSS